MIYVISFVEQNESLQCQFTHSMIQENSNATPDISATSPHSTASSEQEKQSIRNKAKENQANIDDIAAMNEEENSHARKKLRLSKEQALLLEENFRKHATLNPVIELWFYTFMLAEQNTELHYIYTHTHTRIVHNIS
jgi:flagellar biosynthesis GTPase FlhF